MKKEQAIRFWKGLEESTEIESVLRKYKRYGGRRTLQRFVQANRSFKSGLPIKQIGQQTGWSGPYVAKLHSWWQEAFVAQPPPAVAPDSAMQDHRANLLRTLHVLAGAEPLALHDHDLATWWSRPEVSDWPVPKGRAWRNQDGSLEVRLDVESRREWNYLRQHLKSRKVWEAIENCKKALAGDIAARLALMDSIAARIQDAPDRGGLGLPIEADLGFIPVTRSEVTIYSVFTIHDQVLSRALELRHSSKRKEEFDIRDPGYPDVISLGGAPVIRSTAPGVRSRAVSFLLEAQENLTSLPEAQAAAQAYRDAVAAAVVANNEVQDVLLMPSFPPDSACDLCKPWVRGMEALP